MDWLKKHKGHIDCGKGKIILTNIEWQVVECQTQFKHTTPMICAMKVTTIDQVLVVREYLDVFLEELPGPPLDRDVEFFIDLILGTTPIAKMPYRMVVNELAELKKLLKEL